MDKEYQKVLSERTHIFSSLFVSFSINLSIDSFILEAGSSFLNIIHFVLYIGIWILIGQVWQKCYQYRHISILQLILLENSGFEFFYQGMNWRCYMTLFLNHLPSWSLYCKIVRVEIGKASISLPFFVNLQTHTFLELPAWVLPTSSPLTLFANIRFLCKIDLVYVLSVFYALHWRKISQCDGASCFGFIISFSYIVKFFFDVFEFPVLNLNFLLPSWIHGRYNLFFFVELSENGFKYGEVAKNRQQQKASKK